ncbi:cytochrome P450 [Nonomuraea jabiensis]|uniref:Cytochrome P450 n=1 Tax=Nonomuraea jabiensis TaxID=882448 RepID=A0A7W9LDL7_9ACTN|nr:cytochrome P450 [Nonomuraea jabiensis]MBB5779935.1 cytochrome P450 [Nonomuraea jabiensis]
MEVVYNPYDPAVNDDPYPVYARLRREAPLYHNAEHGFWALSRHADVSAALGDSALLSSDHGPVLDPAAWGPQARTYLSFVAMDPPDHTRMRAIVSRAFTPRRVAALEPMIRQIARGYIEEGVERGTFDFARDFAAKLPLDVISELVGVPPSDRADVRRRSDILVRYDPQGKMADTGLKSILSLGDYYASIVADRRATPRDDLVSALVADGGLSPEEIVAFLFLLIGAGSETTTHLLSAAWYWAWRHPGQRAAAFGGAITPWVEESLRYDTPAHGIARRLTGAAEWHGVRVPADAKVLILIGSANRDESVFPDPDAYDLGRDTSRSISFGVGRHYCLGGPLARLEARVALEELTKAVSPSYEIDPDGVRRTTHGNVRGMVRLPTTVAPA